MNSRGWLLVASHLLIMWDLFHLALYVMRGSNEISSPSRVSGCGMLDLVLLTLPPSLVDKMLESRHCPWGSMSQDAMWLKLPFIKHGPMMEPVVFFVE